MSRRPMPTSAERQPSWRREGGSRRTPSVRAACSTRPDQHNVNPTEPDPPDRHGLRWPKSSDNGHRDYLDRFLATQPDTPLGLRNRAMLCLGYELLTRRSELVALRSEDLEARSDGMFRVLIRRSKADPFGAGRIAFTSRRTADLLRVWLDVRGPGINWLFCPVYQGRPVNRDLSTTTVKRLVKQAAERAGLDPSEIEAFSGHSMRVGAAQDLLTRGFDTAAIMRAGGWKSINVLARYLEQAEHNVWA